MEDQRYKTCSKADNQISNLPCVDIGLCSASPKLFMVFGREEKIYHLIKRVRKTIKSYFLFYILFITSYVKNNWKVKNPRLVMKYITRISCFEFAHLSWCSEVDIILFKQNVLTNLLFCKNWMRYVTLAQMYGLVLTDCKRSHGLDLFITKLCKCVGFFSSV